MLKHDRNPLGGSSTERAQDVALSKEVAPSPDRDSVQAVTATFDALHDHHARLQEREDVKNIIVISERLNALTAVLVKAFGKKLDLQDDQSVDRIARSYRDRLQTESNPVTRESFELWGFRLEQYQELNQQLKQLNQTQSTRTVSYDRDAQKALNAFRIRTGKQNDQETVKGMQDKLKAERRADFDKLRNELDLAMNKGDRAKLDLMDADKVSGAIEKWKAGLQAAKTDTEKAKYTKWIDKLERLNNLRVPDQEPVATGKQESASTDENTVIESFMSSANKYSGESPELKIQVEEANRLHPELIQQVMLQGAVDQKFLQGDERQKVGEQLLSAMKAQEKLRMAEDAWLVANFGEEYPQLKARKAELEKRKLALHDWYGAIHNKHVSTKGEVVNIEEQFRDDPDYAEVIARKSKADLALDQAMMDIAHQVEDKLKGSNSLTADLFTGRSENGVVRPEFIKEILYSIGGGEQKKLLKDWKIPLPEDAMSNASEAFNQFHGARQSFVREMFQEVNEESTSVQEAVAAMKVSKQSEYDTAMKVFVDDVKATQENIQTDAHVKLKRTLERRVGDSFDTDNIDRTLGHQENLIRVQKGISQNR